MSVVILPQLNMFVLRLPVERRDTLAIGLEEA